MVGLLRRDGTSTLRRPWIRRRRISPRRLQSVVKNPALVDGNKRLGWLSTAVFVEINGIEISSADNDAVYELVLDVAASRAGVDEIAQRLRDLVA